TLGRDVCSGYYCYDLTRGGAAPGTEDDFFLVGALSAQAIQRELSPVTAPAVQSIAAVNGGIMQSLYIARNAHSVYFPIQEEPSGSLDAFAALDAKTLQDIAPAAGDKTRYRKALYA